VSAVASIAVASIASIAAVAAAEAQRSSGAAAAERLARQLQLEGQIEQMQVRVEDSSRLPSRLLFVAFEANNVLCLFLNYVEL
jgi:TolA-binding protein